MADEKISGQEEVREPSLEELFEELEAVTGRLEGEDVALEEAFSLYNEGMNLLKKCNGMIDRVEKQVLVLDEDGSTHEF